MPSRSVVFRPRTRTLASSGALAALATPAALSLGWASVMGSPAALTDFLLFSGGRSTVTADAPGHITFARALASVLRAAASVGSLTLVTFGSKGSALPYLAFCRAV